MKNVQFACRGVMVSLLLMPVTLLLAACGTRREASVPASPPTATPITSTEETYYYNQVLGRDSIRPVYDPEFVHADEAQIKDEELVLAIAIDGQAKAYPITVLNSREMVNDELAGIPILATW